MRIRAEVEPDHAAVARVLRSAFETCYEARLVDTLRAQARPIISLVAEEDGAILGHILFSPVSLVGHEDPNMMGLAPMAVAPEHQRQGVGSALVRAGLERARQLGCVAVVVLGHPEYYPRFGFSPASGFGLSCEYDVPAEAFMAIELQPDALRGRRGTIKYHAALASTE